VVDDGTPLSALIMQNEGLPLAPTVEITADVNMSAARGRLEIAACDQSDANDPEETSKGSPR